MRARLLVIPVLLVLLAAPAAEAATHTVTTMATGDSSTPFAFSPESLTIQVGDTVRWVNGDGTYHTTTSRGTGGASNGALWEGILDRQGATFEHTFTEVGTFPYFCSPHASFMTGAIVVTDDETGGGNGGTGGDNESPGFTPMVMLVALALALLGRRR